MKMEGAICVEERDQWRGQGDQRREWGQMCPNTIAVHSVSHI